MSRLRSFGHCNEQYAAEKVKVNDDKLSVIKDYAANLGTLTDNQAQTLVSGRAEADQSAYQLRTKYIPMFPKVLPGKKAALFFQLDRRIGVLLDLQVASQIPLVEPQTQRVTPPLVSMNCAA
jgi:hypothetical protein